MKGLIKTFAATLLCVCFALPVAADQQTTVLSQSLKVGNAEGVLPYIDGNLQVDFEKMANDIISQRAKELLKHFGNNGELDYTVTLNRPSVVSILLRASFDGRTLYEGLNLDLTSGKEIGINEFFVNSDRIKQLFDKNTEIVFTEKGVLKRSDKRATYEELVPYSHILPYMRIGEAGRILQIAKLTQNANGKTLRLPAGSAFAIKLDSNPSTGYSWQLKPAKNLEGNIVKIGSSFIMPAANDNRTGMPGTEILMFAAGAPGVYDLCMEYKRPWEMFVNQTVAFKLIVE